MAVLPPVKPRFVIAFALVAAAFVACLHAGDAKNEPGRPRSDRSTFLDAFLAPNAAIVKKPVEWVSGFGEQRGWLFRAETNERLPALLLIANPRASDFFLQSGRELASIGFAVLLVEIDGKEVGVHAGPAAAKQDAIRLERGLAQLCSAVRWIRRRDDLFPDRIGVLGWGKSARSALDLAAAQNLQAAVVADAQLPLALGAPLSIGLRQAAVLIVRGASENNSLDGESIAALERALGLAHVEHRVLEFKSAKIGFMDTGRHDAFEQKSADRAWFEIYEFLGKHVEDAELNTPEAAGRSSDIPRPDRPFASISDVMRAVNGATGVCGEVAQSLGEGLREEKDWKLLHARAAIMVDSGGLLMELEPRRGSQSSWRRQAASYHDAAAALATAADRRNIVEARRAFDRLKTNCNRCHSDHR
jgi:dienelactone hydrolase